MRKILASGLFALGVLSSGVVSADEPAPRAAKSVQIQSSALKDAHHLIAFMEGSAHGVADLLKRTRPGGDARATACVNESLSQVDVLMRRAKERAHVLADAVARGDAEDQERLSGLIRDDRERQREVVKAAFACVGVTQAPRGKDIVIVQVTIDKTLPPEPKE
jgi:hypothetical protein